MSFNRENVTWLSPEDGLWRRGFFTVQERSDSWDEDFYYDPEWDVDYDYSSFQWVSRGCRTADEANASWRGANPGSATIVDDPAECREYDHMAKMHLDPAYAAEWTKKNHTAFLAESQKKIYESGVTDTLLPGTEVTVYFADKMNPGSAPMGISGPLHLDGDWLVMDDWTGKTRKVYNQSTGKLHRHGWNGVARLSGHSRRYSAYRR